MLLLKINYTNSLDRAAKSVRYHAFRSREFEGEQRGMFSRTSDHADVRSFIDSLDDPLTRDYKTRRGRVIQPPKLHRLMFSLSRREFEACGFTSWKPVIREAMARVEAENGFKLDWVAAEHQSATHPHVHVDIKSVYTAPDGSRHRLVIKQELRLQFRRAVEEVMQRERQRTQQERQQQRALDQAVRDITESLLRGLRDAGRADGYEPVPLQPKRKRRHPSRDQDSDSRGR